MRFEKRNLTEHCIGIDLWARYAQIYLWTYIPLYIYKFTQWLHVLLLFDVIVQGVGERLLVRRVATDCLADMVGDPRQLPPVPQRSRLFVDPQAQVMINHLAALC